MGMSTHVVGIKLPDAKWKKMKKIYDACREAETSLPKEVEEFFNDEPPDDKGVLVDLEKLDCCTDYNSDYASGFEINLKKLPADVTIIRFYNAH